MTDRITKSVQNGLALFIVWLVATGIYVSLKVAEINAPEFGSAYITITGGFMAGLGIIASRKNVRVEQAANTAIAVVSDLVADDRVAQGDARVLRGDERVERGDERVARADERLAKREKEEK